MPNYRIHDERSISASVVGNRLAERIGNACVGVA